MRECRARRIHGEREVVRGTAGCPHPWGPFRRYGQAGGRSRRTRDRGDICARRERVFSARRRPVPCALCSAASGLVIATGGGIVTVPGERGDAQATRLRGLAEASEEVIWDRVSRKQETTLAAHGEPAADHPALLEQRESALRGGGGHEGGHHRPDPRRGGRRGFAAVSQRLVIRPLRPEDPLRPLGPSVSPPSPSDDHPKARTGFRVLWRWDSTPAALPNAPRRPTPPNLATGSPMATPAKCPGWNATRTAG